MEKEDGEILGGNKLIADFMGAKIENPKGIWEYNIQGDTWATEGLCYHSNWNWLMEVVEKITQIEDGRFTVDISSVGMWACFIKRDDVYEKNIVGYGGFYPTIVNVWKSVVGFVIWYNKNFKGATAV